MTTTIDLWSDLAMLLDYGQRIEATSIPLERIIHAVIGRGSDNVGYLELTLEDGSVLVFSRAGMTITKPVAPASKSDAIRKMFPNIEWRELRVTKHKPSEAMGYMVWDELDSDAETFNSDRDWLDWADAQRSEARREVETNEHLENRRMPGRVQVDTNPKDWFEWAEQGGTMTDDQWRNFLRNEFKDEEEK